MHPVGENRLELCESLCGGVARTLVLGDDGARSGVLAHRTLFADNGCLYGRDLTVETAFGDRHGRLLLRNEPEPINVLSCDPVLLRDAFGRAELVRHVPRKIL